MSIIQSMGKYIRIFIQNYFSCVGNCLSDVFAVFKQMTPSEGMFAEIVHFNFMLENIDAK